MSLQIPGFMAWTKGSGFWAEGVEVEHPGRVEPSFASKVRRFLAPVVKLSHRPTLEGLENLPTDRPFMLVANHSAGLGIAEILSFMVLYLEKAGLDRPLAGFALPLGFRVPGLRSVLRGVGAIPSTYAAAEQALAAGVPLLVFPGGDHETLRPVWEAHQVDFGGRTGFLRAARRAHVPIVPMGIRGSHFTAPVLWRSRLLATLLVLPRLIGQKRWGLSVLGVIVSALIVALVPGPWPLRALLVWLWLGSPLVFQAWVPWTIRFRIGKPIEPEELFPEDATHGTDPALWNALPRVESAVQALVDA